jgi:hypothetical protein
MARTVLEAVKLNVWLAWVSSTKVADVVVTAVDEVTTYLLSKDRSVAKTGATDATENNRIRVGTSFKTLMVTILRLPSNG